MSLDKVIQYLKQFGIENRIQKFNVSSATVELAAQALNCKPERIAKTLSFKMHEGAVSARQFALFILGIVRKHVCRQKYIANPLEYSAKIW